MDLNRLWNTLTRMLFRSVMDAGVDHAVRKGKVEAEMTPEERRQAQQARDIAARVRKFQTIARRLWR